MHDTPRFATLLRLFTPIMILAASGGLSAAEPIEVPVWNGIAPGSEGIEEREIVVDRGQGKGYVDRSISSVHRPTITVHRPTSESAKLRAALVICPGGGFTRVVVDKEGHDFAKFLATHGIVGVVLKYRTVRSPKHNYGVSALEADVQRAIRLTRHHAAKWRVDPTQVGVFGFSAGGHVASTAATHFDAGNPTAKDPVERLSCRPDFLGMGYPLLSMQAEIVGTRYPQLLLGPKPSQARVRAYSNELQVTPDTPPSFICHAENDTGVKVENTRRFAAACRKAGVSCTTYIRPDGGHGFGIRDQGHSINGWHHAFAVWLKTWRDAR
ncbi:MAG: alpha/beta hydrolase [Planctomycetaceae bacterium]